MKTTTTTAAKCTNWRTGSGRDPSMLDAEPRLVIPKPVIVEAPSEKPMSRKKFESAFGQSYLVYAGVVPLLRVSANSADDLVHAINRRGRHLLMPEFVDNKRTTQRRKSSRRRLQQTIAAVDNCGPGLPTLEDRSDHRGSVRDQRQAQRRATSASMDVGRLHAVAACAGIQCHLLRPRALGHLGSLDQRPRLREALGQPGPDARPRRRRVVMSARYHGTT